MNSSKRETRKRWIQRGRYAVEVEVEVHYPSDAPTTPCIDAATAKWIDEIAKHAENGDVDYLKKVGRVFEAVAA